MNGESRRRSIETLSVLIIVIGSLAIGIPKWADLRRRDAAARMLADVELVRAAVYRFYSDSAAFPREAPGGQFSDELAMYLPATFNRTRSYGIIEYRNWPIATAERRIGGSADGRPPTADSQSVNPSIRSKPQASNVIALAIVPRDPKVAAAASAMAFATPQFTMGSKFFFILFGS